MGQQWAEREEAFFEKQRAEKIEELTELIARTDEFVKPMYPDLADVIMEALKIQVADLREAKTNFDPV